MPDDRRYNVHHVPPWRGHNSERRVRDSDENMRQVDRGENDSAVSGAPVELQSRLMADASKPEKASEYLRVVTVADLVPVANWANILAPFSRFIDVVQSDWSTFFDQRARQRLAPHFFR